MARRLVPTCADVVPDDIYADLDLPEGPIDRPYVVLNMVSTVDGIAAIGGRAAGIGSRLDRRLMRRLRAAADALLVGAGTLRAEIVDPTIPADLATKRRAMGLSEQPLAVTLSARLDLVPTHRFFLGGRDRTIILSTHSAPSDRVTLFADRATVLVVGDASVDLASALRLLRARFGVRRLVVEGGPSTNRALLDAGLVDELFVTIAGKLAGGPGSTIIGGERQPDAFTAQLALVSLYVHEDELFARYAVRPATGAGT